MAKTNFAFMGHTIIGGSQDTQIHFAPDGSVEMQITAIHRVPNKKGGWTVATTKDGQTQQEGLTIIMKADGTPKTEAPLSSAAIVMEESYARTLGKQFIDQFYKAKEAGAGKEMTPQEEVNLQRFSDRILSTKLPPPTPQEPILQEEGKPTKSDAETVAAALNGAKVAGLTFAVQSDGGVAAKLTDEKNSNLVIAQQANNEEALKIQEKLWGKVSASTKKEEHLLVVGNVKEIAAALAKNDPDGIIKSFRNSDNLDRAVLSGQFDEAEKIAKQTPDARSESGNAGTAVATTEPVAHASTTAPSPPPPIVETKPVEAKPVTETKPVAAIAGLAQKIELHDAMVKAGLSSYDNEADGFMRSSIIADVLKNKETPGDATYNFTRTDDNKYSAKLHSKFNETGATALQQEFDKNFRDSVEVHREKNGETTITFKSDAPLEKYIQSNPDLTKALAHYIQGKLDLTKDPAAFQKVLLDPVNKLIDEAAKAEVTPDNLINLGRFQGVKKLLQDAQGHMDPVTAGKAYELLSRGQKSIDPAAQALKNIAQLGTIDDRGDRVGPDGKKVDPKGKWDFTESDIVPSIDKANFTDAQKGEYKQYVAAFQKLGPDNKALTVNNPDLYNNFKGSVKDFLTQLATPTSPLAVALKDSKVAGKYTSQYVGGIDKSLSNIYNAAKADKKTLYSLPAKSIGTLFDHLAKYETDPNNADSTSGKIRPPDVDTLRKWIAEVPPSTETASSAPAPIVASKPATETKPQGEKPVVETKPIEVKPVTETGPKNESVAPSPTPAPDPKPALTISKPALTISAPYIFTKKDGPEKVEKKAERPAVEAAAPAAAPPPPPVVVEPKQASETPSADHPVGLVPPGSPQPTVEPSTPIRKSPNPPSTSRRRLDSRTLRCSHHYTPAELKAIKHGEEYPYNKDAVKREQRVFAHHHIPIGGDGHPETPDGIHGRKTRKAARTALHHDCATETGKSKKHNSKKYNYNNDAVTQP